MIILRNNVKFEVQFSGKPLRVTSLLLISAVAVQLSAVGCVCSGWPEPAVDGINCAIVYSSSGCRLIFGKRTSSKASCIPFAEMLRKGPEAQGFGTRVHL